MPWWCHGGEESADGDGGVAAHVDADVVIVDTAVDAAAVVAVVVAVVAVVAVAVAIVVVAAVGVAVVAMALFVAAVVLAQQADKKTVLEQ